nr:MAG: putative RNA-dependent RNA polymerase [Narnaviridae sp.]
MFMRSTWDSLCDSDKVFRYSPVADFMGLFELLIQAPDPATQVSWCKYLTCWPLARFLRQDAMPVVPAGFVEALGDSSCHFPLRGHARRHFRNLLASRDSEVRAARVMNCILQSIKRGCAEVPKEFQELTALKHQKSLTQDLPRLSDVDREKFRKVFREIWNTPGRGWRAPSGNVYKPWIGTPQMQRDVSRPANPGFNAAFGWTRFQGGRAAAVRAMAIMHMNDQYDCDFLGGLFAGIGDGGRSRPLEAPRPTLFWRMTEVRPGVVVEERVHEDHLPTISPRLATEWAIRELEKNGGICQAEVAAILEPLKCRLITKGSPLCYFAAQPMQRAMWERLQKFPCFKLTGCPLDASMLAGILLSEKKLGITRFDQWVSGDYSAATDGLSQEINTLCLEEAMLAGRLSDDEKRVARAVLGNHQIQYGFGGDVPASIMQSNGQLMGSVLSFPVLCAINIAAYKIALDEHLGIEVPVRDLPALVNGDDICFRADAAFYEIWKKWTRIAGFTLSPGKNYLAKSYVTINSEAFIHRPGAQSVPFVKLPFLNPGLLYAGRSVERELEAGQWSHGPRVGIRPENGEMPFTAKVNRIVTEAADPHRALLRVHELFRAEIAYHTHHGEINMHAAPELGGLGIVLPDGAQTRFTAWQQRVAGFLQNRWKTGDFGTKLEVDGVSLWDLNAPMRLDGRLTYQLKRKPNLRFCPAVRPGVVVARDKLEPYRADERELRLPEAGLMNYQATPSDDKGQWKIAQLSAEDRVLAREYSGPKVLKPTEWNMELREQVTERSLHRTDSSFMDSYVTTDGELVTYRTKPILLEPRRNDWLPYFRDLLDLA